MINTTDIFVNKNIMMIKSAMNGTSATMLAKRWKSLQKSQKNTKHKTSHKSSPKRNVRITYFYTSKSFSSKS